MKCYVCKTGDLTISGCHEYCTKCNFTRFVVTEDYIDSCISLLGVLCSNTKFYTEDDLKHFVSTQVAHNLPKLHEFMQNVQGNGDKFMQVVVDGLKTQAINLQIGEQLHNEEEPSRDLQCACGNKTRFKPGSKYPSQVVCEDCEAQFIINHELGIYEPLFLCECGYMSYTLFDEASGLCGCNNCNTLYLHNAQDNHFYKVV